MGWKVASLRQGQKQTRGIHIFQKTRSQCWLFLSKPEEESTIQLYPFKIHRHTKTHCVSGKRAVQLSELSMRAFDIHRREEVEKVKQQRGHCLARDITL